MFVSAHPDDEVHGAGGTLLKFKAAGAELMFVLAIDPGEEKKNRSAEEERRIRLTEFQGMAREFGAKNFFLDLQHYPRLTRDAVVPLVKAIREFRPEIVMILAEDDYHIEHKQTARLVKRSVWHARRDAFVSCGEPYTTEEIWEAEGDRPLHDPNHLEDISNFMDEKLRMFSLYHSQLQAKDLHDAVSGLNCYRGVMYKKGRYAEAFRRSNLIYG